MGETERDTRIAELLSELMDGRDGSTADLESVCRKHPDLAGELCALWATVQVADLFSLPAEPEELFVPSELAAGTNDGSDPLDEYELLDEIGRGGMGIVYCARQRSLSRIVALKMILRPDIASPAELARFHYEAEVAARLDHPNIVPIYQVAMTRKGGGPADNGAPALHPFFTMRLIEGQTLAGRLVDGPLSPRETATLLLPICRAVQAAHDQGLVHRDLKPSNILIDLDHRAYVTDFGLAKQFQRSRREVEDSSELMHRSITQTGAILGTPSYMAPEQAAGREIGPSADIYSLGAILYACLTGRPPLQGASPAETVMMVLDHDPLPPRLINPQSDPDLELVVLKCLQKPADLRYSSAAALGHDLAAYLANEPISARSTRFYDVLSRAFRETHHASVLENWGLLWIWHAIVLFGLCVVTNALQLFNVTSRWPYLLLWTAGLGAWGVVFWGLRRRAGPVTFVERQIAHAWAGAMICSTLLYAVEWLLDLPVLTLAPILALVSGMTVLMKAAILSGVFYLPAAALFATSLLMAFWPRIEQPNFSLTLFGLVSGASFFLPGLKYWRQGLRK